jgi:hypothetical protein
MYPGIPISTKSAAQRRRWGAGLGVLAAERDLAQVAQASFTWHQQRIGAASGRLRRANRRLRGDSLGLVGHRSAANQAQEEGRNPIDGTAAALGPAHDAGLRASERQIKDAGAEGG